MNVRRLTLVVLFILSSAAGFFFAPFARIPWIVTVFLSFAGIAFFDTQKEIIRTWANTLLFLLIYGLTVRCCLGTMEEAFWRDYAACIFFIGLLFEQNSRSWTGMGLFRSMMSPAVFFLLLILAQNAPFLRAEVTFLCALLAILTFCFLELFSILREHNDLNSGSFMSAVRVASCGAGSLFYAATFLPGAAKEYPFVLIRLVLPALGLAIAVLGGFFKHWRRRYILFCCNWSVFLFWAAITGEATRFYAAIAGLVAGTWTIMMTNRAGIEPSNTKDLYMKLSAWGVPGSLMFTMIVFGLYPSENPMVRIGSVLWLIAFFVYWSGLRKFEFPRGRAETQPWKWRHSVALGLTVAGAAALAGGNVFANFLSQVWSVAK